jgi:hypothetical protein
MNDSGLFSTKRFPQKDECVIICFYQIIIDLKGARWEEHENRDSGFPEPS